MIAALWNYGNYGDMTVFTYLNPPAINGPYRSRPLTNGKDGRAT
jgi:hypothetical protein